MVIEIKDLRVGDEIIVPSQSRLKYLKILRTPQLGTKLHYKTKSPLYKAIKCSGNKETQQNTHIWNGKPYITKTVVWKCTPEEHNVETFENLNYKTFWLVNRKQYDIRKTDRKPDIRRRASTGDI